MSGNWHLRKNILPRCRWDLWNPVPGRRIVFWILERTNGQLHFRKRMIRFRDRNFSKSSSLLQSAFCSRKFLRIFFTGWSLERLQVQGLATAVFAPKFENLPFCETLIGAWIISSEFLGVFGYSEKPQKLRFPWKNFNGLPWLMQNLVVLAISYRVSFLNYVTQI